VGAFLLKDDLNDLRGMRETRDFGLMDCINPRSTCPVKYELGEDLMVDHPIDYDRGRRPG
jgi:hypothetical protein